MHQSDPRFVSRSLDFVSTVRKVRVVVVVAGLLEVPSVGSVSQGLICSDNPTCCCTEIAVQNQTVIPSQSSDTGPICPSPESMLPGVGHWNNIIGVTILNTNQVAGMTQYELRFDHWYDSVLSITNIRSPA